MKQYCRSILIKCKHQPGNWQSMLVVNEPLTNLTLVVRKFWGQSRRALRRKLPFTSSLLRSISFCLMSCVALTLSELKRVFLVLALTTKEKKQLHKLIRFTFFHDFQCLTLLFNKTQQVERSQLMSDYFFCKSATGISLFSLASLNFMSCQLENLPFGK